MLADLDETIRELLIADLPIKNGEIEVSFDQPKREWSARLNRPTVNLFLYDMRENPTLRSHQWEQMANGQNGDLKARLKRLPFRVDCLYMLTAWANDPADEHRLLTRAMLALFRYPVLPEDRLVGSLRNQRFELMTRLASHDRLTNPAEVWSALDNELRPSISYIVTLAFDPWEEVTGGDIIRTLVFHYGQADSLPRQQNFTPNAAPDHLNTIVGKVRAKGQDGAPLAGVEIAVKGSSLVTTSDAQGRFSLGNLPAGEYTLVVRPAKGKAAEKQITIPAKKAETYDMEL